MRGLIALLTAAVAMAALVGVLLVNPFDNVSRTIMRETVDGQIYEIAAEGDDLRAYGWTDPTHGWKCLFVAGTSKAGLVCKFE